MALPAGAPPTRSSTLDPAGAFPLTEKVPEAVTSGTEIDSSELRSATEPTTSLAGAPPLLRATLA